MWKNGLKRFLNSLCNSAATFFFLNRSLNLVNITNFVFVFYLSKNELKFFSFFLISGLI